MNTIKTRVKFMILLASAPRIGEALLKGQIYLRDRVRRVALLIMSTNGQ
jgi:hypothetical protein